MAIQLWQCSKCGTQTRTNSVPPPKQNGPCPETPTKNHVWKKVS